MRSWQKSARCVTSGTISLLFHKIYLDTATLITAFGGDADKERAAQLMSLIEAVDSGRPPPFATSELSLAETLVRPMRRGDDHDVQSFDNVITSSSWLEVHSVSRAVLWGSALLRSQYASLKLPDAIHIATALATGCSHILTADKGIKDRYALKHWDRQQQASSQLVDVIRPDESTVQAIQSWLRA